MDAVRRTRDFFAPRAATWDARFPDDDAAFAVAVAALDLAPGDRVLDVGCGTGRALAHLRNAVGPEGAVTALDVTAEMLAAAASAGRAAHAALVLGDASRLPLRPSSLDAVFAAGLVTHLDDPIAGLREFARVCRLGARLALFHPVGRATLAARHGHSLRADDVRAAGNLRAAGAASGWELLDIDDDGDDRYLAIARRRAASSA